MTDILLKFAKKSGVIAASAILSVSVVFAGVIGLTQPQSASAYMTDENGMNMKQTSTPTTTPTPTTTTTTAPSTGCTPQTSAPLTNIIYCGLSGSTASQMLSSFMHYYNANNDSHGHTDLQAVYNTSGASFSTMKASDMYVGQSFNDGTIHVTINGVDTVVGTNAQIASRCGAGIDSCQPSSKYTHLVSNVYTRDATWFFSKTDTHVQTLVHINPTTGMADFALWTPCGNMLKFTPVQPKRVLKCESLTFVKGTETDSTVSYRFTAVATEQNQTNGKMLIDFGDGASSQTVSINQSRVTFNTTHAYTKTSLSQTVTAQIMIGVNGLAKSDNGNCVKQIVIPPKASKSLVCTALTPTPLDAAKTQYTFTATASEFNTTISSFSFDFGDGSAVQTVATSSTTATSSAHTFQPGTYTIQASVTGPLGNFAGSACATKITVLPPTLVNTGPGSVIGIFAATTTLGGLFHQFVLRRKLHA